MKIFRDKKDNVQNDIETKVVQFDDQERGSGSWLIEYKDIGPESAYDNSGAMLPEPELMRKMIISITSDNDGMPKEKLNPAQMEHFFKKVLSPSSFFGLLDNSY